MKEFKKWYSKTYGMSPTFKEEASWRAALKWALTQDTDLNSTELAYAVRKELGI